MRLVINDSDRDWERFGRTDPYFGVLRAPQYHGELSEADRRKTKFLAVLAHELRNPLAPIRHGLQLIRSQAVQAETFGKVRDMLDRQVDQMVRLVNDLLDVARITSGKVELRKQAAEIAELVKGAVETSMPLIEASGHTLVVSVPEAPIWVLERKSGSKGRGSALGRIFPTSRA